METIGLVPAYNEGKNIVEVIKRLKKLGLQAVVIDDGSKDNTAALARKAGAIVLQHKVNKGKAEAIKSGFNYILKRYTSIRYAVLIDADLQYVPEEATKFLKILKEGKADYMTGYRKPLKVPYANRFGNFVWRVIFNILFGVKLNDTNCGYIALTRRSMEIMRRVIYGGYILENAMMIEAIKNHFRIKQVPVNVTYGKRKIRKFAKMFFGNLIFILTEGFRFRLQSI